MKTKSDIIKEEMERCREEIKMRYVILGIKPQPVGNLENWVEGDLQMLESSLSRAIDAWDKEGIKEQ